MPSSPASSIKRLFAAAQRELRANRPDAAAALFLEVIGLPDLEHDEPLALESAHTALAELYLRGRKPELAEFHLRKAIAVNPKEPDLYRRLGELLSYQGEFAAAAAEFLRASDLEPHHPEYLHLLGRATFMGGDHKAGRKLMEQSYALDETSVPLLTDLAMACGELGDHGAALRYLEQAVALDPANPLLASQRDRARERAERRAKKK